MAFVYIHQCFPIGDPQKGFGGSMAFVYIYKTNAKWRNTKLFAVEVSLTKRDKSSATPEPRLQGSTGSGAHERTGLFTLTKLCRLLFNPIQWEIWYILFFLTSSIYTKRSFWQSTSHIIHWFKAISVCNFDEKHVRESGLAKIFKNRKKRTECNLATLRHEPIIWIPNFPTVMSSERSLAAESFCRSISSSRCSSGLLVSSRMSCLEKHGCQI